MVEVPNDWQIANLGQLVDLLTGYPFKSDQYIDSNEGMKLLRGDNIIQGQLRWENVMLWSKTDAENYTKYLLEEDDIVIAMDRPWIQAGLKFARISYKDLSALLVQRVARLRKTELASIDFIFQIVSSHEFSQRMLLMQTGSTVPHISSEQIKSYPILLPPLEEQRKIAAILGTWDRAIGLVEALIAALQARKRGLMQLLLTGEIRFHEFVESKDIYETHYGNIPSEWSEVTIGDIAIETQLGTSSRGMLENSSIIPLIKMGNLGWGKFELSAYELISEELVDNIDTLILNDGDFLFNTRNTPDLVGKSVVWHNELPKAITDNNIQRIRFSENIAPDFISQFLTYGKGKKRLRSIASGSTSVAAIYWKDFSKLNLFVPHISEQRKISGTIRDCDYQVDLLTIYRSKFQEQKKGLMQKLLTGQVRVKV